VRAAYDIPQGMRDANFGHCLQGAIGFYLIALLRRIALASIASSTGLSSPLDDETALNTSAVAACCARALFSSSQTPSSCFAGPKTDGRFTNCADSRAAICVCSALDQSPRFLEFAIHFSLVSGAFPFGGPE
jgi:hypothetical protein